LADLENTLGLIGLNPTEYAPLLAPLVDVPLPEDRVAKFAPEELRRRQLAAMAAWILAAARTQAIVLAFEDLHWADPSSLDLLRTLAERGAQAPLLIVATARPEFRAPWSVRSHHSVISLSPLDSAETAKMVRDLSSRHALPKDIVEGVSERTGGVPLFVEEVTRLLLERGEQGGAQAIPPTLQQSLAARLDRLGVAREIAQIGAVLGRGFSCALLQSVAGLDEGALQSALERLAEADILFVEGHGAQATYRFKHALIQDAAYDSLLRSRRQALHRRAAEILRDSASPEPEAVAHHFTQAGLDDLAIEWWGKAGDQALRRSAFQEAIAHLGKAIAMADKGEGAAAPGATGTAVSSERLKLQSDYGEAVMWSKGFAAEETKAAFARVLNLAAGTESAPELYAVLHGQWTRHLVGGELRQAEEIAKAFLHEAETAKNATEAAAAGYALGATYLLQGKLSEAQINLERVLTEWSRASEGALAPQNRIEPGVAAAFYLALAVWQMGDPGRARCLSEQAVQRAAELAQAQTSVNTHTFTAVLEIFRDDPPATLRSAELLLKVAREHRMELYAAAGEVFSTWARTRLPVPQAQAAELGRLIAHLSKPSSKLLNPLFLGLLAERMADAQSVDAAVSTVDDALALAEETGERFTDSFLHRLRGTILLKRDPANPAPAEEAFLTALAIAKQQGARSFELRAALALAKLYQSTGRLVEADAILAPALDGFSPTPEMPEVGEAQALLAALMATDEVKAAVAQRERRLHLQTAYGQAMMWSKGFASEETKAAFDRAAELTANSDDFSHRFAALHGQWTLALVRGELQAAREQASAFLKEAGIRGRVMEAGVAHRGLALISYFAGNFTEAQTHCERALGACSPENDLEARERSGEDTGTVALCCLALTSWQLGEVARARELIDKANQRAAEIGHVPSIANPLQFKSLLEILRGDASATLTASNALKTLSGEHGMTLQRNWAEATASWAYGHLHDPHAGAARLGRALDAMVDRGVRLDETLYLGLLAQLEAKALGADSALARVDKAISLTGQREPHFCLGFLHRLRGEFLLKRDPRNTAPAEEAYRTAIEVAKGQGARSYQLVASLSLAKLYQSINRPADAHVFLAPALEGFAPTSEMPEIAEAQALLGALAATDQVKVEAAHRQRLTQLRVAYGNALLQARGIGAPETTEAFARAREGALGDEDAPERLAVHYGLWAGSSVRGDLPEMRAHAEAFLNDVEDRPDSPEAGVAHRAAGLTCWFAGDYREARDQLQRALILFEPGRDDDLAFRFGLDPGVAAMGWLAIASWPLGNVDGAVSLIDRMQTRMANLKHVGTLANGRMYAALFELLRGDRARVAPNTFELVRLAQEYDLNLWRAFGVFLDGWASAASGASGSGLEGMRHGVELLREQNVLWFDGLLKMTLAEAEAQGGDPGRAVAILDEALATCDRTGYRAFEGELHRMRGEILRKQIPANSAPAEEAFLTAIAVAKRQSTRSFELRAALALAKVYRTTGRDREAHEVLGPAMEGFAPTSDFPEIGEALEMVTTIEAGPRL
jgi:predicted ATPase